MKIRPIWSRISLLLVPWAVGCSVTDPGAVTRDERLQAVRQKTLDDILQEAPERIVSLPPDPAVGQGWTIDWNGVAHSYAIVAKVGAHLLIECTVSSHEDGVILAYQVDPLVDWTTVAEIGDLERTSVVEAWAGPAGGKPLTRAVPEAATVVASPLGSGSSWRGLIEHPVIHEPLDLGGRAWNARYFELPSNGGTARYWEADGFTLQIKRGETTHFQLKKWRVDATPALDWSFLDRVSFATER
ncbi:MAG: hypothetical protein AAGG01_13080 [Planctomycetota bacterium]